MTQTIASLEKEIHELETKKKEIVSKMSQPETYQDIALIVSLQKEYSSSKAELESKYENWEEARLELQEILDKIKLL